MGKLMHRKDRKQEAADRLARRAALLETARSVILSQPKAELSLESVDRAAGQRTGSASMFFGSLEGIVFRILREELSSWSEDLSRSLQEGDSLLSPEEMADLLASDLVERALLCRLLALLPFLADHHSLELGLLRELETWRLRLLEEMGPLVESRCRNLNEGGGLVILRRALLLASALETRMNPPSGLLLIMMDENFSALYPDAAEELCILVEASLTAMCSQDTAG